jgi:hypothetical protein
VQQRGVDERAGAEGEPDAGDPGQFEVVEQHEQVVVGGVVAGGGV